MKEVDIDGDADEQSGGGSSAELTKLDTIKSYVNILYDHYNIEFDIVEETSTQEIEVVDENEELTGEVLTLTTKNYKFVPKTNVPRVYLNITDGNSYTSLASDNGLILHSTDTRIESSENAISTIIFDGAELTIQQLKNYDIIQIGVAKFTINATNDPYDYASYIEFLNWIRNNMIEKVEIPILLYSDQSNDDDVTKGYNNFGFIPSELFLNGDMSFYSQTIYEVLEEES